MDLSAATLLIVDFQNDFVGVDGYLAKRGLSNLADEHRTAVLDNAGELIARFQVAGKPVIWLPTILREDAIDCALPFRTMRQLELPAEEGFLAEGSKGAEFIAEVKPGEGELLVPKKGFSAFYGTPLDRLLANLDVDTCVIASGGLWDGLADTVRHGGAYGYGVVVVPDACGYPSDAPQIATLEKRATFASTADVVQALQGEQPPKDRRPKTTLIVVDMQNDYVHPMGAQHIHGHNSHMGAKAMAKLVANNQRLLEGMRKAGHPVVYVVTERRHDPLDNASPPAALKNPPVPWGNDYLVTGTWGAEVLEDLAPRPEDFIERKKGRSGFAMTPLHRLLRNLGVTECLVSGGAVHGCLEDTIRVGAAMGYAFTMVTDAVYPGPPSEASRQVLGTHTTFKTTDEVLAGLTCD